MAGPRLKAASVTNCVSFFKHISWSFSSQGTGCSRGGAAARAGRSPSGEEKVPRGPPSSVPRPAPPRRPPLPARRPPSRAARQPAPMSGWATCDPRAPGRPLPPTRLARRRGPPLARRKTATPETSPGRAGWGSRPGPRASPLPCSREATILAGGAGRVVRERARAWGGR